MSLLAAPQRALWFQQRVQLYSLWNASEIFCVLVPPASNMRVLSPHARPQAPSFSFHTSTCPMSTSRNSGKFLPFEVLMIPAGRQKNKNKNKTVSFFSPPEYNVLPRHCPNASIQANEKCVLNKPRKDFSLRSQLGLALGSHFYQFLYLNMLTWCSCVLAGAAISPSIIIWIDW